MYRFMLVSMAIILFIIPETKGQKGISVEYPVGDSLNPIQYYSEITIKNLGDGKHFHLGNRSEGISIVFKSMKKKRTISLILPPYFETLSRGSNVKDEPMGINRYLTFKYDWQLNATYKFLIAKAVDSTARFSIYSGYIWLPEIMKWKFLASTKINWPWGASLNTQISYSKGKNENPEIAVNNLWAQRQNGSWKNLKEESTTPPIINLSGHADSLQQRELEIKQIEKAITTGKSDVKYNKQSVYYTIMKEGTGRHVTVDDTVVVNYKGYLFSDGTVFDQTKEKPATFPLKRLIRGWQIGVPLCKVGGKIKLVIPSDLAYSIRTRSPKIPPNSILVFEIEVLDTKPPL